MSARAVARPAGGVDVVAGTVPGPPPEDEPRALVANGGPDAGLGIVPHGLQAPDGAIAEQLERDGVRQRDLAPPDRLHEEEPATEPEGPAVAAGVERLERRLDDELPRDRPDRELDDVVEAFRRQPLRDPPPTRPLPVTSDCTGDGPLPAAYRLQLPRSKKSTDSPPPSSSAPGEMVGKLMQ